MTADYEQLLQQVEDLPLSKSLSKVLGAAVQAHDDELTTWTRLELLGYVKDNPVMTEQTVVPEYRTVSGQWFDKDGSRLAIPDASLAFMNAIRLREGVPELEIFADVFGMGELWLPDLADLIRENLRVEVSVFRFNSRSVSQVLASIKAQLVDHVASHSHLLRRPPARPKANSEDIVELRPNFYGIGINLNALLRRWRSRFGGS